MLQGSFIEVHYKRNNGTYGVVFTVSIIAALVILAVILNGVPILLGYNIIYFTGLITFGLSYLVCRIIKRLDLEYEIEISNDLFDVARIIARRKREELASFSIKDCEYIGPSTSDRFQEDSDNSEFVLNITDMRSLTPRDDVWYAFVKNEGISYIVAFVFKDEMYPVFRRYNPRKTAPYVPKTASEEA